MTAWLPIDDEAKSGFVLLLTRRKPRTFHVGKWNPKGSSWEPGQARLMRTGVWDSEGGWFEPSEVTHYIPIPSPPESK